LGDLWQKNSNLKIVQQQTAGEIESRAEREREKDQRENSWKLARQEIGNRVRKLRLELETYRSRLEGMTFDVVTGDTPWSVDSVNSPYPLDLAEMFNPCIPGRYDPMYESISHEWKDELFNLKSETADTAFQIGVLAGAIFAGCSDREIDRLERGLIHATMSRNWRCKD
jgi:hypothetical protein